RDAWRAGRAHERRVPLRSQARHRLPREAPLAEGAHRRRHVRPGRRPRPSERQVAAQARRLGRLHARDPEAGARLAAMTGFAYHRPSTLDDALAALAAGDALPVGGGTDLVPWI